MVYNTHNADALVGIITNEVQGLGQKGIFNRSSPWRPTHGPAPRDSDRLRTKLDISCSVPANSLPPQSPHSIRMIFR